MKTSHETKRAKRIIVELVRENGGEFSNKSRLFKAFWMAHLAYAEKSPGYLSTWPITRMPNGPGIDSFDQLLSELLADGWLTIKETEVANNLAMVLSLGPNCPPKTLPESALKAIREGVEAAHDNCHRQSRVWREAKDGEELDIYLDLMTDEDRDQREANLAILAGAIGSTYSTSGK